MVDHMEKIDNSLIQHGRENDRVYLMKLARNDDPTRVLDQILRLAEVHDYGKLFAKIPDYSAECFLAKGFHVEARVPRLFNGSGNGLFLGFFRKAERGILPNPDALAKVLDAAKSRPPLRALPSLKGILLRRLGAEDAAEAAEAYGRVFDTYPFPIHDPAYLKQTMTEQVMYVGAFSDSRLVAVASAEMDRTALHAEMTDFATLPEMRGRGLARHLLCHMEKTVRSEGIRTAYTIARAVSHGMNITFGDGGYTFAGTLKNNTNISGGLESMNVWYKELYPA